MAQKSIRSFFKPKEKSNSIKPSPRSPKLIDSTDVESKPSSEIDTQLFRSKTRKRHRDFSSSDEDEKSSKKLQDSFSTVRAVKSENVPGVSPKPGLAIKNELHLVKTQPSPIQEDVSPVQRNESNQEISVPDEEVTQATGMKTIGMRNIISAKCEDYDPSKDYYHPINDAFWGKNEDTPYRALARTFEIIEEIRGRLKMIEVLGNFFCSVILLKPEDLLPCIYLSINQIGPAYEGLEIGVAETTLMKVICKTTGRDMKQIKNQTNSIGDLGLVAEQSRVSQKMMFQPAPLTVAGIHKQLLAITKLSGQAKTTAIQNVFVACRQSEARYFIRSLIGKLRIGIAEQSLLQALATALVKSKTYLKIVSETAFKKEVEATALIIKTAYCQCPNYDKIIPRILEHEINELLDRCPMEPGIPLKPMLAQPTKGVAEVLQKLQGLNITCEWKYDGERAQIHCDKYGLIKIFSRNQEDNTSKYPDVISRADCFKTNSVESYIIDSEVVAWDVENKQILPFQVLSTRKRKNVDMGSIKIQVCVYAFDLLYLNGKSLVTIPLKERRQLLKDNFVEVEGQWQFAIARDTNDVDEIQQFLEDSVKGNCEGLMVKALEIEATYEIARRSRNWLKLKKDYMSGVGDSLDLVVIGGYKGKGKRTGQYGGFLLACYDSDNEEYQSICKIGTGFSEEDLKVYTSFFQDHILKTSKSYYRCDSTLEPDDWFEPVQVWEIKCADLSLSPVHKAAIGIIDPERGISLRFPRFVRLRSDKTPETASTAQQVAYIYSAQDQIKNQITSGENTDFETDFY